MSFAPVKSALGAYEKTPLDVRSFQTPAPPTFISQPAGMMTCKIRFGSNNNPRVLVGEDFTGMGVTSMTITYADAQTETVALLSSQFITSGSWADTCPNQAISGQPPFTFLEFEDQVLDFLEATRIVLNGANTEWFADLQKDCETPGNRFYIAVTPPFAARMQTNGRFRAYFHWRQNDFGTIGQSWAKTRLEFDSGLPETMPAFSTLQDAGATLDLNCVVVATPIGSTEWRSDGHDTTRRVTKVSLLDAADAVLVEGPLVYNCTAVTIPSGDYYLAA